MSWNYRVIKGKSKITNEEYYVIGEVYYDNNDNNKIIAYSDDFIIPSGESKEDLLSNIKLMEEAFNNPIINIEDLENLFKEKRKNNN